MKSVAVAERFVWQAPEYPFPFAIDEMFDAYKLLYETNGKSLGMRGTTLNIVVTGDSA